MLKFSQFTLVTIALFFTQFAYSGELRLDYSGFYSHLRKINNDELQSLQFAFGFINVRNKELCQPTNILVHTDKKDIPIDINANRRFVLPTEKALKMAKAEVHIQLIEPNNQCDLSVLLQVNPDLLTDGVTGDELQVFFDTFTAFFDKMGGFLSFMMPSPEGLHLKFANDSEEPLALGNNLKPETSVNTYTLMETSIVNITNNLTLNDISAVTAFVPN